MNRRGFLRMFGGAAAAAIVAPPVKYFLPPIGGWSSPLIVNPYETSIGEYADFFNYSDLKLITVCNPAVAALENTLLTRFAYSLEAVIANDRGH